MTRTPLAGSWAIALTVAAAVAIGLASATATATAAPRIKIVAFGDSLVAGFGVKPSESFPAQLQAALEARGHKVEIVNSGVSGDTAAAGLERFDWAVPDDANAVILALGANDMLTGRNPELTRKALTDILDRLAKRNLPVLIAGMRSTRNWGEDYRTTFDAIYPALAERYRAELYPFMLDGVAMERALNQPDGLHPNPNGVAEIVRRILPAVERLIARVRGGTAAGPG